MARKPHSIAGQRRKWLSYYDWPWAIVELLTKDLMRATTLDRALEGPTEYFQGVPADPAAVPPSSAWHAERIRCGIGEIRANMARESGKPWAGLLEDGILAGLRLGAMLEDHSWQWIVAPIIELGTAKHDQFRKYAASGVAARKIAKRRGDAALVADVKAYRRLHPDHGRNREAVALLRAHGRPVDPLKADDHVRAIDALRKRIARLDLK